MAKQKITEFVREALPAFLAEQGLYLYHCEYSKEGRDWFLRVYIDRVEQDAYVSSDDCEKVSRYLSDLLDQEDPIEQNYYLEVSSPGMDRELITQDHFDRYVGQSVDVKLYRGLDGSKQYTGTLLRRNGEELIIEKEDGTEVRFPDDQVAKVRLTVVF